MTASSDIALAPKPRHTADTHAELEELERIAHRMDTLFRLPIVNVRVGMDSILGLIPGIGDTISLAPAAYIIWRGHNLGAPAHLTGRMAANVGIDWLVGAIPLVGDLFDVGFKANRRNVALLRSHFGHPRPKSAAAKDAAA